MIGMMIADALSIASRGIARLPGDMTYVLTNIFAIMVINAHECRPCATPTYH